MANRNEERFLTSADVARELGVVPERVRQLARRGDLHFVTTAGGMRLFTRDEVDRIAEQRRRVKEGEAR